MANLKTLAAAIGALAPIVPTAARRGVLMEQVSEDVAVPIAGLLEKMALFVRKLEFREGSEAPADPGFTPAGVGEATSKALRVFDDLGKEHVRLSSTLKGCAAEWAVVTALLKRTRLTSEDLKAARADFYKAGAQAPGACGDTTARDDLDKVVPAGPGRR